MVSYLLDDSLSMQDYHLIVSRPQNRVYAKYIHVSSYAFFSHKVGMYPRKTKLHLTHLMKWKWLLFPTRCLIFPFLWSLIPQITLEKYDAENLGSSQSSVTKSIPKEPTNMSSEYSSLLQLLWNSIFVSCKTTPSQKFANL